MQLEQAPFDEPMRVSQREGKIVVSWPNGIHGSFLPAAAKESGYRLLSEAAKLVLHDEFILAAQTPPKSLVKRDDSED